MNEIFDFDVFRTLYIFKGHIENRTPLLIGSGKSEELGSSVDIPIIRYSHNGKPYIPGSSLKGVLRNLFESIARARGQETCLLDEKKMKKIEEKSPCIVCQVFGNTSLASHIYVYDCIADEKEVPVDTKTGIAIDRFLGVAKAGALFEEEFISPGVKWEMEIRIFNIDLENPQGEEEKNKAEIMKEVFRIWSSIGIHVGSRKTVGHGLLYLLKDETTVTKYTLENGVLKGEKWSLKDWLGE